MRTYWTNLKSALKSSLKGLMTTYRHLVNARHSTAILPVSHPDYFKNQEMGIMTLQYPHESLPIPDNGRYKLHNEVDDCIVCDKCAKICPVDCIEIEPIKAVDTFGYTSDGTPKRIYAAKFDIDMGKCCFCGLCTTVCPTECLTMTKSFDFSEYDVADHTYSFATMTPLEILEKKKEWEVAATKKQAAKADAVKELPTSKPTIKKVKAQMPETMSGKPEQKAAAPKPKFRPRPMIKKKKKGDE